MDAVGRVSHFSVPRFSIVILNYNNPDLTIDCIKSISKSDYDLSKIEVILIDNNSSDNSEEKLLALNHQFEFEIILILNNKNLLFTGGNNQGIVLSRGDYVILLNNDTIVDKDWLTEIDKVIKSDLSIGIAQPKLLKYGKFYTTNVGEIYINSDILDTSIPKIGWFGRTHCLGLNKPDFGQYNNEQIDYACGACMVLSRDMLSEVGLFDDRFGMHCEDMDLSVRAKKKGYKVVLVPKAKIWHIRQATMKKIPKWVINWYLLKNRILFMLKHRRIYGHQIS